MYNFAYFKVEFASNLAHYGLKEAIAVFLQEYLDITPNTFFSDFEESEDNENNNQDNSDSEPELTYYNV